jgi:SnoaL-like domain
LATTNLRSNPNFYTAGIEIMNAVEVSQRAIDAWNMHDADAIVGLYAEGATYHTPRFDHPLKGQTHADFAKSVWTAFPDMSLEIISCGDTGGGLVATQLKP